MHISADVIWEVVGWVGQFFFGGRFLIQWIATERLKRSVVPPAFWYMSMVGTIFLLAYAIHSVSIGNKGWPLVGGFSLNMIVYLRNMYFIRRTAAHEAAATATAPTPGEKG